MKKQKFLNVSYLPMVILGISVLLFMIACPSPSKDSGSTAKKVDSGIRAVAKGDTFSVTANLTKLAGLLPDDLGKKSDAGETAIKPSDLEYILYYVQEGATIGGKTVDSVLDSDTKSDLVKRTGANDADFGKIKGTLSPGAESVVFKGVTTLERKKKYYYFIRPRYPDRLKEAQKSAKVTLSDTAVASVTTELPKVTIVLTVVKAVGKGGTFQVTATKPTGDLGKKADGKTAIELSDLRYIVFYAKDGATKNKKTANSSISAADLSVLVGDDSAGANTGKVANLTYEDLTNTAGVKGLIGLDPGDKYYYFIRTAYTSGVNTEIASDSDKDTTVQTVNIKKPLVITLSGVVATPKARTFQVTATAPAGYLGIKADGKTAIKPLDLRYIVFYAKDGATKNKKTADSSISADDLSVLVGDDSAGADIGKVANLTHEDLTNTAGVKGITELDPEKKYYYFIRTVYATEGNMPMLPKGGGQDTLVQTVTTAPLLAKALSGGPFAYPSGGLSVEYNASSGNTIDPETAITDDGIAYAITARDSKDKESKATVSTSDGTVTVAAGLLVGEYTYAITVSKNGSLSQTATLTVVVTPTAPDKATGAKIKAGSQKSDSFTVEWTAPTSLGGDALNNMVYTVYYKEGNADAGEFDSDQKKGTYVESSSPSKSSAVRGDASFTEVAITGLDPETEYVFFVVAKNKSDNTKVSYSDAVTGTTSAQPVESAALTNVGISIPSGRDKIKVDAATAPVGAAGAFGKKSGGSDIVKDDFKYEIYYAKVGAAGTSSSSNAAVVKAAVDTAVSAEGANTQDFGKTVAVDLAGLKAEGGIALGVGVTLAPSGASYRIFIHTVYPSGAVPESHSGILEDTEARSYTVLADPVIQGPLAYDNLSMPYDATGSKEVSPSTSISVPGITYMLTKRAAANDGGRVTVNKSTGTVTIAAGLLPGEYLYEIIASKVGFNFKTQTVELTIEVTPIAPDQAKSVMAKMEFTKAYTFIVVWNVPDSLGGVEDSDIEYTVYYAEKSENPLGSPGERVAYAKNPSATSVGPVAGDEHALEEKITDLKPGTEYVFFVETKHTGDIAKVSYSALGTVVTVEAKKLTGGPLAYNVGGLSVGYNAVSGNTIVPETTVTDDGVTYAITDRDSQDTENKVTVDESTGKVTVEAGLPVGEYTYEISASKDGFYTPQTAGLTIEVTSIAPGKAKNVMAETGSITAYTFIATWDAPDSLGGDADSNIEYTVYYAKKSEHPLDSPESRKTYAKDDSSSKRGTVRGDVPYRIMGIANLDPNTEYVFFVETKNTTDSTKVSYSDRGTVTTDLATLSGGPFAYNVGGLLVKYNAASGNTIDPKTPITDDGVTYAITSRDSRDQENKVTIDESTGTVTVKAGLPAGEYEYEITASKADFKPQTAELLVTVEGGGGVPGAVVSMKTEEEPTSSEITVTWDAPANLGDEAANIEYTVYYAKKSENLFDSPEKREAYAKDPASTKSDMVAGNVLPLEVKIDSLDPGTAYVFFVKTNNKNDPFKLSISTYSIVVTTIAISAAVTDESFTAMEGLSTIKVSNAKYPIGDPGAFGKDSVNSNILVSVFSYMVYYAEVDTIGINGGSTAEDIKKAVDRAMKEYSISPHYGKIEVTSINALNAVLGVTARFTAEATYRVFILTVYPEGGIAPADIELKTEAKSITMLDN